MDATLLPTLKAAILAETDPAFIAARNANEHGVMAAFYNAQATPTFPVVNLASGDSLQLTIKKVFA